MSKFVLTGRFKWIDPKEFDSNKYSSNSFKDFVLDVDVEYPKELRELHNDFSLVPDKIEIKKKCCLIINSKCFFLKTFNFIQD